MQTVHRTIWRSASQFSRETIWFIIIHWWVRLVLLAMPTRYWQRKQELIIFLDIVRLWKFFFRLVPIASSLKRLVRWQLRKHASLTILSECRMLSFLETHSRLHRIAWPTVPVRCAFLPPYLKPYNSSIGLYPFALAQNPTNAQGEERQYRQLHRQSKLRLVQPSPQSKKVPLPLLLSLRTFRHKFHLLNLPRPRMTSSPRVLLYSHRTQTHQLAAQDRQGHTCQSFSRWLQ